MQFIHGRRTKCCKSRNERKGSAREGRWGNTLDCSHAGLTVPHKVLLERVMYYQHRGGNCFVASFLTVLQAVDYNKRSYQVIYKMIDDMKQQDVEFISNQVLIPQKRWFSVIIASGLHFLKRNDVIYVLVCIQEVDAVTEHAIAIWQGKIIYINNVSENNHMLPFMLFVNKP
jgi:hypothetical protein